MQTLSHEKRNVLLLACAQTLFQTVAIMLMTLSGLTALRLASDKSLATLPVALMLVAATATMIPASLLMQRLGRKVGFLIGTGLGIMAGLAAAASVWVHSFGLFIAANILIGGYQGFAQYYRFAAADVASADFKSRAISWVIAGGVVAAILGPTLVRSTQAIGALPFVASYLALSAVSVLALLLVTRMQIPAMVVAADARVHNPARPLRTIMRQPIFMVALMASTVGFAVMVMVMTATPVAMQMCGQGLGAAATVIQWHVLGMFFPSFFTGHLIRRYGVLTILGLGLAMCALHVGIALAGNGYWHFLSALIFLGVGWNFLFVGGTTLLTDCYAPSERAKTQAAHDFIMFGVTSLASFSAGGLLNAWGWRSVNLTVLPFLALALLALLWFAAHQRKALRQG